MVLAGAIGGGVCPPKALRVRVFMPDIHVVGLLWRARDGLREDVLRRRLLEIKEARVFTEEATVSSARWQRVLGSGIDHVGEGRAVLRHIGDRNVGELFAAPVR